MQIFYSYCTIALKDKILDDQEGNDDEKEMVYTLPFNPLKDKRLYDESMKNDWGIQFSHTLEEQIGGQLEAGFTLTNLYEDTNGSGNLHEHNVPTFIATRAVK